MCARSTRRLMQVAVLLLLATAHSLIAQQPAPAADNPLIGTWTLVVAKSRYNPGPPPQSQTRTYEIVPRGTKTTVRTIDADGQSTTVEFTTNYDSIEYRVMGSAGADGIAMKKIDDYTAEASLTHAGRVTGTARRVISPDGRTLTITFSDVRGVVHNVAVYQKQ